MRSVLSPEIARRHLKMIGYFSEDDKADLYTADFRSRLGDEAGSALGYLKKAFDGCKSQDFINRLLYVDFKTYLPECLMTKIDIATMANSLEGRSPFLDHEFVELVYGLPGEWKLKGLRGHKWILKEAFKDKLPPTILNRGKMGFGIPLGAWFRGELKSYWEGLVLSPQALGRGYFNEAALKRLWEEHQTGKRDHGYRLWALLMLELWNQNPL
jgi:asparagine synthase (glutamine-hydrolysing)